jgi:hypothetical protein
MFFYGLCAFVPDKRFAGQSRMSAVLVDASDPDQGPPGAMKHTAALYCRESDSWKKKDLMRLEVSLVNPHANEKALGAQLQPYPTKNKPSEVDSSWRAVWWLADMHRIDRQAAQIRSDVLAAPGEDVSHRVAARISMPFGHFRLDDLARYKGNFFTWTFLPTPSGHKPYAQALAMKCLWIVKLNSDEARLKLTSLDNPANFEDISIPSNGEDCVDLIVGNLSKEGHESLFSPGNAMGQQIDTDLDFRWFYLLSHTASSEQPVPVPEDSVFGKTAKALRLDEVPTADPVGGGPVRCPQALFDPPPEVEPQGEEES